MNTLREIIATAQALPSAERAQLIALLWNRLSPEDWPMPGEAWLHEANRRSDAIDSGRLSTDSWENVRNRARQKA